jgi:hypothetical protein
MFANYLGASPKAPQRSNNAFAKAARKRQPFASQCTMAAGIGRVQCFPDGPGMNPNSKDRDHPRNLRVVLREK